MAASKLLLHTFFRSSCSARVRTAAYLKDIPLEYTYVHLLKKENQAPTYVSYNPSGSVPTLTLTEANGNKIIIRQSVAILEFFEEYFPDQNPLLPRRDDIIGRARVRELVNIIANDIQPPTNLRSLRRVKKLGGDPDRWAKEIMTAGLEAFDKVAAEYAGEYSVGDEVTLADVVLAPAVEQAARVGVDVKVLETVGRVYEKIKVLDAFRRGDWKNQEDTPEELREK